MISAHLEAVRAELGDQRRLADDEYRRPRVQPRQVTRQHERGVDDVVFPRRDAQAGELPGVVHPGLQRLVGKKGDSAAGRAQRGDRLVGAGDQGLAAIHGAVEVEEPAAMRQREAHERPPRAGGRVAVATARPAPTATRPSAREPLMSDRC